MRRSLVTLVFAMILSARSAVASDTPVVTAEAAKAPPVQTWDLPAIDVPGAAKPSNAEDERIGDYAQPRWSASRRFTTTRMYVMPRGKANAEYWMRYTAPFRAPGDDREIRSFYELGMGLGHRLQADIYLVTEQKGGAALELKRQTFELRWAIADWGEIWGNPTLYVEYQNRSGGNDYIESKVLVGGQIAPRLHGGANVVLERELGGELENEWQVTGGLSYSAVDSVFHVGVEGYAEVHDSKDARLRFGGSEQLFLAGPSFMLSPIAPFHLLFAPLVGTGKDGAGASSEAKFRLWFVSSWAF